MERTKALKKHDILNHLTTLPQKVLALHGVENVTEFVLHDSGVIEVAEVVGMRLPVQLHFRERSVLEDLLNFSHGAANLQLLGLRDVGILLLVKILYSAGDALHGGIGGGVSRSQYRDCLLLD